MEIACCSDNNKYVVLMDDCLVEFNNKFYFGSRGELIKILREHGYSVNSLDQITEKIKTKPI